MLGLYGLIAHVVFWGLLAWGVISGDLGRRSAYWFVVIWLIAMLVLPITPLLGRAYFTSFVAMLDIVLVFIIFKADIRLT